MFPPQSPARQDVYKFLYVGHMCELFYDWWQLATQICVLTGPWWRSSLMVALQEEP